MRPDLPESYYLDNVHILFAQVERLYADLLDPAQLDFLQNFDALGLDAQKLYIRLLNRSQDWYRVSKLDYPEIACLDAAIDELEQRGCLRANPDIDMPTLLTLFTRAELLAAADLPGLGKLRREQLEAALLEQDSDSCFTSLAESDDLLHLHGRDEYQLCQMLFFGNANQSMTDFVLRDLGLYQFEAYSIDSEHRPYRSSLEIKQHWLLLQIEVLLGLSDLEDADLLRELAAMIPADIDPLAPAYRKSERLRHAIARQLERRGELDAALGLYRRCLLPPSRERCARILDRQGQQQAALDLCAAMIERPLADEELQFAAMFAARLCKKHEPLQLDSAAELPFEHRPEIVDLVLDYQDSVELAVAEHYTREDGARTCFYVENSLFNGVLGMLIWDAMFAPVTGAFFNPFQYRPGDFYEHDFCRRRAAILQPLWASINDNGDIWRLVEARWQQKYGLMNPLVNWQGLDLELIELALQRIEHGHWRALFERVLADLRHNRAGFPDLVHFPAGGGYRLIEVKGPGDNLQKNQQRWMQYFQQHGIPHCLARVSWSES